MICPECAGVVPDTAKVCGYCGHCLADAGSGTGVPAIDHSETVPSEPSGPETAAAVPELTTAGLLRREPAPATPPAAEEPVTPVDPRQFRPPGGPGTVDCRFCGRPNPRSTRRCLGCGKELREPGPSQPARPGRSPAPGREAHSGGSGKRARIAVVVGSLVVAGGTFLDWIAFGSGYEKAWDIPFMALFDPDGYYDAAPWSIGLAATVFALVALLTSGTRFVRRIAGLLGFALAVGIAIRLAEVLPSAGDWFEAWGPGIYVSALGGLVVLLAPGSD